MKKIIKQITLSSFLVLSLILSACGGGGGGGTSVSVTPTTTGVTSSSITNNSTDVSTTLNAFQINFSKEMEPVSTKAAFSITPSLSGTLNISGSTLTFNIDENLKPGTTYQVIISTSAKDINGVSLETQYLLTFRTEGSSSHAPSAISDLSLTSGDIFGVVKLSFTGPSAGSDTMSVYIIKYSSVAITDNNFNSSTTLPSSITIPSPISGTNEVVNIPTDLLTSIGPDEKIYFAVETTTTTGYSSNISNVVSIKKPWAMQVKVVDKLNSSDSQSLSIGNQTSALDGYDKFDKELPPILPGIHIYTTLTGRNESLIMDIREPFPTNQGNSEVYHIVIEGTPLTKVQLEFPQFSTLTPFYDYKISGIGSGDISLTGQTIGATSDDIILNGSGKFEFDLTVSN